VPHKYKVVKAFDDALSLLTDRTQLGDEPYCEACACGRTVYSCKLQISVDPLLRELLQLVVTSLKHHLASLGHLFIHLHRIGEVQ
jgi:hypothetical protein